MTKEKFSNMWNLVKEDAGRKPSTWYMLIKLEGVLWIREAFLLASYFSNRIYAGLSIGLAILFSVFTVLMVYFNHNDKEKVGGFWLYILF